MANCWTFRLDDEASALVMAASGDEPTLLKVVRTRRKGAHSGQCLRQQHRQRALLAPFFPYPAKLTHLILLVGAA
jgi:hypothetical protein